jgi:preprotein translocase SecE subunit
LNRLLACSYSRQTVCRTGDKEVAQAVGAMDESNKKKEGVGEFVRETRAELDRTTFPSSEDVKNTTIIVVISVIFFAIYLFLIDQAWVYILEALTWVVNKIAGA